MNKQNPTKGRKDVLTKRLASLEHYVNTHKGDVKVRTTYAGFTPTTAGNVFYLSGVAQGDTFELRTGNVINLHKVEPHLNFQMTSSCNVRVIILRDKFNTGVAPTPADILDSADTIAPLNYNNTVAQKRFVIIDDFTKHFTVGGTLYDTHAKGYLQEVKTRYADGGATSASALSNNIYACILCDTTSAGTIAIYTRCLFTDE